MGKVTRFSIDLYKKRYRMRKDAGAVYPRNTGVFLTCPLFVTPASESVRITQKISTEPKVSGSSPLGCIRF